VPRRADAGVAAGHRVGSLTAHGVGTCGADAVQAALGHLVPLRGYSSFSGERIELTNTIDARAQDGPIRNQESPMVVQAVAENERGEVRFMDVVGALGEPGGKLGQGNGTILTHERVRRLTPRECERLMGWPDDHTRWDATGRAIADRWRYRMCGNGVVAPVAEWIGRQLPGGTTG
jgi:DNA (cytosine-5)-methyltransferase 1